MRNPGVRSAAPSLALGVAILLSASTVHAQIDYSGFDIRQARDVAINATGALWVIGSDGAPNGGIQRLVASTLVSQPGSAVRIAVEPSGSAWIVNADGDLFQWKKVGTAPEAWVRSDLKAMDVAVGANGAVWAVGTDHRIMRLLRNGTWRAISGAGDRIAVDPAGYPWVVNSNNDIWRWTPAGWTQVPGKARDVSVAPDGTVFVVGMTPKPGGYQILRRTGATWTEVPGAAGVAAAATSRRLSLAQLPAPAGQVVTLNHAPLIAPQPVTVNAVPVITQPTMINVQGTTSIDVSPPPAAAPSPAAQPQPAVAAPAGQLRRIFPRGQSYEAQLLGALNFNPLGTRIYSTGQAAPASTLSPLERGFAQLAMAGAEVHYSQTSLSADDIVTRISTDANARRVVNGNVGALLMVKMFDASRDASTLALREWATQVFRQQKIAATKASLDQYLAWKQDPCGYEGKPARECQTMGELFLTRTPPQDKIALQAMGSVYGSRAADVAAAVTAAVGVATGAAAAVALAPALGVVVSGVGTTALSTALFSAFGGVAGTAVSPQVAAAAASIGATGWAGVIAVPVAAAVTAVVVGVSEGYKVVEAGRVEPMLRLKTGAAMTEDIVIENALSDESNARFFFLAFTNAAANRFAVPQNTVDGEVRFFNQAGFVSRFNLAYTLNGSRKVLTTEPLTVGNQATFAIPAAATAIVASGEWLDLVAWKSLFERSIRSPTFIGYTAYGTAFQPSVKDEYPEISNIIAKPNELTVTQGGGYVAWVRVSYNQGGREVVAIDQRGLSAGWSQKFDIPKDATNVQLMAWTETGLVWEPWKAIVHRTWPSPPNECVKVYGTTLDPRWNNECR